MDEFSIWLNLHPSGPTYFYRVTQHVIAFNNDNEVVDSYNHIEDFKDSNLLTARNAAIDYLEKRYVKLPDGFIYPYVSPAE